MGLTLRGLKGISNCRTFPVAPKLGPTFRPRANSGMKTHKFVFKRPQLELVKLVQRVKRLGRLLLHGRGGRWRGNEAGPEVPQQLAQ